MRNLSDTIERLAALGSRRNMPAPSVVADRLRDFPEFGSNPGALRARIYIPPSLPEHAALVVVLHGCTQTAAGYDHGSGWSQLADRHGFALLFPEQQRANNANLCFNWFAPGDIQRGGGEALSIAQMIEAASLSCGIDRNRIFVTGLSAGGAMASAMLATYPELFAGGAIIAGLPYGCASTVPEAFDRMRGHGGPGERALQTLLRKASDHEGPWPRISIWQGTADKTVDPSNAEAIFAQWRAVHGLASSPSFETIVAGYPRRVWRDADGREAIEDYRITGMGHGTPLAARGRGGIGASGPFMLETGISSTLLIARFWGLAPAIDEPQSEHLAHPPSVPDAIEVSGAAPIAAPQGEESPAIAGHAPARIKKVIEDALRAAGLMS